MINSHPSLELLTEYSSGSLRLSHALCVAAHIEQCDQCAQQVAKLSRIGAHLFDQQEITEHQKSHQNTKEKLLAQLGEQPTLSHEKEVTAVETCADDHNVSETATPATTLSSSGLASGKSSRYKMLNSLKQFVTSDYDQLNWVSLSPSIKIATLCREGDGSQVAITRVKPGGKLPHHRHTGNELTTILEGSFSDEKGIYKKGDFIIHHSGHKHQPIVTKDAECLCLTVLDAPIQFTGFFTRWLNPLLRRQYRAYQAL